MEAIFVYTRAQALSDGVLVDVSQLAQEAGFRCPTALTQAVWEQHVRVPEGVSDQDETGRLWDILWMLRCAIVRLQQLHRGPVISFTLLVKNDPTGPKLVTLKAICGPGNDGEMVLTILLPYED